MSVSKTELLNTQRELYTNYANLLKCIPNNSTEMQTILSPFQ